MAQAQARRGDEVQAQAGQDQPEAIKYGHVFAVTGELAGQPISPRDAAAMRSAEDTVAGVPVPQASGGGYSAGVTMESAAAYNQAVGAVHPGQASDAATNQGITVTQTAVPGGRIVTEFVAGQVVGQYSVADQPVEEDATKITIGESLEATTRAVGDRPVDRAGAEAIRAAETTAQGADIAMPGGLAEGRRPWRAPTPAMSSDATAKLAGDKDAGREDAARLAQAETYSDAGARTKASGLGRRGDAA